MAYHSGLQRGVGQCRIGAAVGIPRSDSAWGGSDLYPTAQLFWNKGGVNNFMAYLAGDIPVGSYSPDRLANLGIGHGAIDGGGAYTYLNTKTGTDFSATLGFDRQFRATRRPTTRTGSTRTSSSPHAQFLNEQFFVGVGRLRLSAADARPGPVGHSWAQTSCARAESVRRSGTISVSAGTTDLHERAGLLGVRFLPQARRPLRLRNGEHPCVGNFLTRAAVEMRLESETLLRLPAAKSLRPSGNRRALTPYTSILSPVSGAPRSFPDEVGRQKSQIQAETPPLQEARLTSSALFVSRRSTRYRCSQTKTVSPV